MSSQVNRLRDFVIFPCQSTYTGCAGQCKDLEQSTHLNKDTKWADIEITVYQSVNL